TFAEWTNGVECRDNIIIDCNCKSSRGSALVIIRSECILSGNSIVDSRAPGTCDAVIGYKRQVIYGSTFAEWADGVEFRSDSFIDLNSQSNRFSALVIIGSECVFSGSCI